MPLRISFSVILLISLLFMPFWLSFILMILGILYFSYFFEAFFLFLLSDLLYGVPEPRFFNIVFVSSLLSLIFLITLELLKKKLKFYPG